MRKLIVLASFIFVSGVASAKALWIDAWPGFHGITTGATFGKHYRSIEAGYVYGVILNHYSSNKVDHRLIVGPSLGAEYIIRTNEQRDLLAWKAGGSLYYIRDSWGFHAGLQTSCIAGTGNRNHALLPEAGIIHEGFLFGLIWSVNYRYCIPNKRSDSVLMKGGYVNFSMTIPLSGGFGWFAL